MSYKCLLKSPKMTSIFVSELLFPDRLSFLESFNCNCILVKTILINFTCGIYFHTFSYSSTRVQYHVWPHVLDYIHLPLKPREALFTHNKRENRIIKDKTLFAYIFKISHSCKARWQWSCPHQPTVAPLGHLDDTTWTVWTHVCIMFPSCIRGLSYNRLPLDGILSLRETQKCGLVNVPNHSNSLFCVIFCIC